MIRSATYVCVIAVDFCIVFFSVRVLPAGQRRT
jgi:hypothetical protein